LFVSYFVAVRPRAALREQDERMDPWVWAILLLLVGMTLAVLDIFVPSGGVFAFLSVCAIIAAIWMGFSQGAAIGAAVLAGAVFGTVGVVVLALKCWPSTSIGKRMLLQVPTSEEVLPENAPRKTLESLIGRVGRAKCPMLPSGIVAIDGTAWDAISEGLPIESGQRVRVIEIRGNRAVVRGLPDEPSPEHETDPLAQPVDWESPDPFRPPQA
jgi:membrane-bound ClpP family serine protease